MDIKQRLQQAIDQAHGIPPLEPDTLELCQDALAHIKRVEKQLPEEMRDCTITLNECELGHTWLSATNWLDHGCVWCRMMRIRELASAVRLVGKGS
jgi:hypothetical protein